MRIRKKDLNLIRKIAWSFHNTTGLEFQELFAQACLGYCEAINSFDRNKEAKKSTWAWVKMKRDLINFIKEEQKHRVPATAIEDLPDDFFGTCQQNHKAFQSIMDELPAKECRSIVKMILEKREEFEKLRDPLLRLKSDLRENGWKHERINATLKSTKLILKNLS